MKSAALLRRSRGTSRIPPLTGMLSSWRQVSATSNGSWLWNTWCRGRTTSMSVSSSTRWCVPRSLCRKSTRARSREIISSPSSSPSVRTTWPKRTPTLTLTPSHPHSPSPHNHTRRKQGRAAAMTPWDSPRSRVRCGAEPPKEVTEAGRGVGDESKLHGRGARAPLREGPAVQGPAARIRAACADRRGPRGGSLGASGARSRSSCGSCAACCPTARRTWPTGARHFPPSRTCCSSRCLPLRAAPSRRPRKRSAWRRKRGQLRSPRRDKRERERERESSDTARCCTAARSADGPAPFTS